MYDDTLSLIIPINLFIPLLYSFKKYVCIFFGFAESVATPAFF